MQLPVSQFMSQVKIMASFLTLILIRVKRRINEYYLFFKIDGSKNPVAQIVICDMQTHQAFSDSINRYWWFCNGSIFFSVFAKDIAYGSLNCLFTDKV